jgi:hypothetical protein
MSNHILHPGSTNGESNIAFDPLPPDVRIRVKEGRKSGAPRDQMKNDLEKNDPEAINGSVGRPSTSPPARPQRWLDEHERHEREGERIKKETPSAPRGAVSPPSPPPFRRNETGCFFTYEFLTCSSIPSTLNPERKRRVSIEISSVNDGINRGEVGSENPSPLTTQ